MIQASTLIEGGLALMFALIGIAILLAGISLLYYMVGELRLRKEWSKQSMETDRQRAEMLQMLMTALPTVLTEFFRRASNEPVGSAAAGA